MRIRVFEAFSGYGSQSMALRNIGVEYEVVAISEIDKYALKAYESIHGEVNNLGDISKIDIENIPEHDLFTYSFPCTDVSIAGKQEGLVKGQTRSGLLYECEKIIEHCKPKYLLLENVKNLVGKKFKSQFDKWLEYLEELGYTNYWQVLNAKDFNIPQNRERIFVISILGEHKLYEFPKRFNLTKHIEDILEDDVDEKYYVDKEWKFVEEKMKEGINVITREEFEKNKIICERRYDEGIRYFKNNICGTLRTIDACGDKRVIESYRIRKITPRECFRLMGLNEENIDKIQNTGISNTQQYKMAGNSIVIQVLEEIFRNLFLK